MVLSHNQMAYVAIVATMIFGSMFVGVSGIMDTTIRYEDAGGDVLDDQDVIQEIQDSDGDGLSDQIEKTQYGTDPALWDTDRDGLSDGWENLNGLDFEPFNPSDYPVYEIGLKYGKKRGSWLVALCGADQAAVELFLNNKIKFTDIPILIESVLEAHKEVTDLNINKINEIYQNTINNTYDLAKV